jgi:hypothetical protein
VSAVSIFNTVALGTVSLTASTREHEGRTLAVTRTNNFSAHRFFGMGFAIGPVDFVWSSARASLLLRAGFECICGRREFFQAMVRDDAEIGRLNVFEELKRLGSLSRGHLLADGYSAAQIDDMEARFERYMLEAGFRPHVPRSYGQQDHPAWADVRESPAAWVYGPGGMPPVPGLAEDFALQLLRSGTYVRLPKRPEPLKLVQGDWAQISRAFRDTDVPRLP